MMTESDAVNRSGLAMIKQYFVDFKVLKENKGAYWAVQGVNVLDATAYFSLIAVSTMFFTDNLGLDDVDSGFAVTFYSTLVTFTLLFSGFITDYLGIRKSLLIALAIQLISRVGVIACGWMTELPGRAWLAVILLALGAPGMAMVNTVFQAANKIFSTSSSRGASFNVWYLLMNLGAAAGGLSVDVIRKALALDITYILVFGTVTVALSMLVVMWGIAKGAEQEALAVEREATMSEGQRRGILENIKSMSRESAFHRMMVLMFALVGVRAVFAYMYLLLPKYWQRVIEAPSGELTEMGLLQAINPICIVVGVILMIPLSNKFNVFKMLIGGAIVSSLSMLFLVAPWRFFADGMAQGYFAMSVCMLLLLSVGEAVWSPKLNEYVAAIAPKGQEGAYLGMSMIPWFLAKLLVGAISGFMLTRWVPEGVHVALEAGTLPFWQTPEAMWLILFGWALSGPIIALLCKDWLTRGAAELEPGNVRASAETATA